MSVVYHCPSCQLITRPMDDSDAVEVTTFGSYDRVFLLPKGKTITLEVWSDWEWIDTPELPASFPR